MNDELGKALKVANRGMQYVDVRASTITVPANDAPYESCSESPVYAQGTPVVDIMTDSYLQSSACGMFDNDESMARAEIRMDYALHRAGIQGVHTKIIGNVHDRTCILCVGPRPTPPPLWSGDENQPEESDDVTDDKHRR